MKNCKNCNAGFEVSAEDRAFMDRFAPTFDGRKFDIPDPTLCPECRQQRRLAHCNERFLYPGQCGLCKKRTLTEYPPHAKITYYCRACWHGDDWDPRDYGRDFDFSRPFFEQLYELKMSCPSQALLIDGTNVNSEYIHYAGSSKNSYLIMHADFCEDCYFGYGFKSNRSCVDGFYNLHSELCYDCVDVHRCYGLTACQDCITCGDSAFLRDCIGCKHCFLCVGLRQKEYCLRNKQLSKEAYEAGMAKIDLGSHEQYQKYRQELTELEKTHSFKEFQGHNTQNCRGDHLVDCKNCYHCFDCEDVEEARYCYQMVLGSKNIMDTYQFGSNLTEAYESAICGADSYHTLFSFNAAMTCSELFYCWYMEGCHNCFACANMNRQKYCIFNKQYSKEDYEKQVARIIEYMQSTGEWGEFFPVFISPFGYNKTTAQMYYPLEKEQVLEKGWKWDDYETPPPENVKTIPADRLPDNIKNTPDDILNWGITCEKTGRIFKIIPQELRFYRQRNLPIPRRHPDRRHMDRFHRRNPRHLWNRQCDNCQKPIQSTWSPQRKEKVYCEECYHKTVY